MGHNIHTIIGRSSSEVASKAAQFAINELIGGTYWIPLTRTFATKHKEVDTGEETTVAEPQEFVIILIRSRSLK